MGARYTKEQHNKRQSWGCGSRAIDAGPSRRRKAAGPLPQGRQWPSRGMEKTGRGKELVAGRNLEARMAGGERPAARGWQCVGPRCQPLGPPHAAAPRTHNASGACCAQFLLSQPGCAAPLLLLPPPTDLRGLSKA